MPTYKTITAAGLALAAGVNLAGCAADPAPPQTAAPVSSTPKEKQSALRDYWRERSRTFLRESRANAAVGLPDNVDRRLAEAAEQDGVPLIFYIEKDGCRWLRLPDRSLWRMWAGGALERDAGLEDLLAKWGGALPALGCRDTPAPVGLDTAAADAANAAGRPYRWSDGCWEYVRVPGSAQRWELPEEGQLSARGRDLSVAGDNRVCDRAAGTPTEGN